MLGVIFVLILTIIAENQSTDKFRKLDEDIHNPQQANDDVTFYVTTTGNEKGTCAELDQCKSLSNAANRSSLIVGLSIIEISSGTYVEKNVTTLLNGTKDIMGENIVGEDFVNMTIITCDLDKDTFITIQTSTKWSNISF